MGHVSKGQSWHFLERAELEVGVLVAALFDENIKQLGPFVTNRLGQVERSSLQF